jgi:central kinetochore subunit Mal2/MCM21
MGEKWLPSIDDDQVVGESTDRPEQDLQGLVEELRAELVSWHARTDAVECVREELGLKRGVDGEDDDIADDSAPTQSGITSLAATSLEARFVRIEWSDGTIGRLKLSDDGIIERAVVIGDEGRQKKLENMLVEGKARFDELTQRLTSYPIS